jgi:hypothetical protein
MIYVAMTRLMLRRLARHAPYGVPSPQRQGLRGLARAFYTASRSSRRKCWTVLLMGRYYLARIKVATYASC